MASVDVPSIVESPDVPPVSVVDAVTGLLVEIMSEVVSEVDVDVDVDVDTEESVLFV